MKVSIDKLFTIVFALFALGHLWHRDIERFISFLCISSLYYRCYLYSKGDD